MDIHLLFSMFFNIVTFCKSGHGICKHLYHLKQKLKMNINESKQQSYLKPFAFKIEFT